MPLCRPGQIEVPGAGLLIFIFKCEIHHTRKLNFRRRKPASSPRAQPSTQAAGQKGARHRRQWVSFTPVAMISAARRGRAAACRPAHQPGQAAAASPEHDLVSTCRAAARGLAQHAARAAGHLGSQLAGAARSAAAAAPPPPLELQQPQLQGLLASVSGSALQEPQQKAFLPDKRRGGGGRGGRNPSVGGVAEGGGTEGGGGVLADADENERFLVSEVDVVGVDGELKDIAMRALSTRANFAYSQKEVGGMRRWRCVVWCGTVWRCAAAGVVHGSQARHLGGTQRHPPAHVSWRGGAFVVRRLSRNTHRMPEPPAPPWAHPRIPRPLFRHR